MISTLLSILSSLGAVAKYIAARVERRELEGVGRLAAYAEAMQDVETILIDISDVERRVLDGLRADRERVLSNDPDNRDNWPEHNDNRKGGL